MKVVVSANRFIADQLGAPGFRLSGVEAEAVDHEQLIERVSEKKPQLVVLAEAPRFEGLALCERLRADPAHRQSRVILVVDRAPEEVPLGRLAASGCDDAVLARLPGEELYPTVARLGGLPDLSLSTTVEVRDPSWSRPSVPRKAEAANLSPRSIDLLCERPLGTSGRVQMALRREAEDAPLELEGEVARSDGGAGRPFRARVHFSDMPTAARERLHDLCLWNVRPLGGGLMRVEVRGAFDQASEFGTLLERIAVEIERGLKLCVFDLSRVRQITSWGARAWILFLRGLPESLSYRFVNGSTLFSRHCGMVADMIGRGEVSSLALPYACPSCGAERARVVHSSWLSPSVRSEPPPFRCPSCGGEERFDELPDRYFSFLRA